MTEVEVLLKTGWTRYRMKRRIMSSTTAFKKGRCKNCDLTRKCHVYDATYPYRQRCLKDFVAQVEIVDIDEVK